MTHSSCTGMLHKTKPERIRHYAQHLHSPLTNVTAQTDKDLNVDVPLLRALLEWTGRAVMGDIQLLPMPVSFINNCGIKRTRLGRKVNDESVISLSAHQCFFI